MATEPLAVRVEARLARWTKEYAKDRGSSQGAIVEAALISFREDCRRGVPDLPSGRSGRMHRRSSPSVPVPAPAPAAPAPGSHILRPLPKVQRDLLRAHARAEHKGSPAEECRACQAKAVLGG